MTVASTAAPSRICTAAPGSVVPAIVGLVLLVTPSVRELPMSVSGVRPEITGARGALVSTTTASVLEAVLALPAVSAALAVMLCVPGVSAVAGV